MLHGSQVARPVMVSLAKFNIPTNGTDQSTAITNALISAKSAGDNYVFIPPSDVGYGVDVGNSIYVPSGMTIVGIPGRSLIKGLGTSFAADKAMLYVADPATGTRYGAESGFRAIGTGATFNLTVSGGKVTAVAIAAGGSGYQQGDQLLLINGTIFFAHVTAGAVTSVVIENSGSGWGAPSNPYGHTNANGVSRCDRIVDPASFASMVRISGLVFDGGYGYGNARLTGTQRYQGLAAYGVLDFFADNIIMRKFPNNGMMVFDCQNADVRRCLAEDCGWSGVFGGPRNGFSNVGLFLLQHPELNTQYWNFQHNLARDIGDVGAEFALVDNFDISHNQILGCSTLGLEGEGHTYGVWQTQAGNGMKPPGDGRISHNLVDGRMLKGHLATDTASSGSINATSIYSLLGVTWVQGNEGTIEVHDNTVQNTTGAAIKIAQNMSGKIIGGHGDVFENVNMGASTVSPAAPGSVAASAATGASGAESFFVGQLQAGRIDYAGAKFIGGAPKTPILYVLDNAQTDFIRLHDLDISGTTDASDTSSGMIRMSYTNSHAAGTLEISDIRGGKTQADGIIIEANGAGVVVVLDKIKVDNNKLVDCNRANTASKAAVRTRVLNGANLGAKIAVYDRLEYRETSVSSNATVPLILADSATITPTLVSMNDILAPQFATKYSISGMSPQPTAYTARNATIPAPLTHPGYVSGNWVVAPGIRGTAASSVPGGAAKMFPITFGAPITITDVGIKIATAGAGGSTAVVAFYADDGTSHQPHGAALASATGIVTSATGLASATFNTPVILAAGVQYWFWVQFSDAATAIITTVLTEAAGAAEILGSPTLSDLASGTANFALGRSKGNTFGVFPTLVDGDTAPSTVGIPILFLKVA